MGWCGDSRRWFETRNTLKAQSSQHLTPHFLSISVPAHALELSSPPSIPSHIRHTPIDQGNNNEVLLHPPHLSVFLLKAQTPMASSTTVLLSAKGLSLPAFTSCERKLTLQ